MDALAIGLAGIAGAWLRYILGWALNDRWVIEAFGPFPAATFTANMLGSFCLAWFTAAMVHSTRWSERMKRAVTTGFMGSFTTFSAWSTETLVLLQSSQWLIAVLYVVLSVFVGLLAAWGGFLVAGKAKRRQATEEKML
jgi:fluoride exporter